MPETSIANISQDYIDGLREQTTNSKNLLDDRAKAYDVKLNEFSDASEWQKKIDAYWLGVKKTQKIAKEVFTDIDTLQGQAFKVNNNIEYTLDAVKLLVYNVREVSRVLEIMTNEYYTLKHRIDASSVRDSTFKPSQIMAKLTSLGEKLNAASLAVETAITKALDLAKAFYLLQTAIDSEKREHHDWVVDHIIAEYIEEGGHLKLVDLHEVVEVRCGERTVQETGLEWYLLKLEHLLRHGMHGHHHSDEVVPPSSDEFVPTFPLPKGDDRYYDITKVQNQDAKDLVENAQDELDAAAKLKMNADSSYKAYKAALEAAEAAKNAK
jgi:hypothetical protein